MKKSSMLLVAGMLCATWSPAQPAPSCGSASLCTLWARNNGGSVGGAVYFDATAATDVDICGFDINVSESGVFAGLEVYTVPGTYVGNELNAAAWTQVAVDDGTGIAMGIDVPTVITLAGGGFTLPAGSWGIALVAVGVGHDYTGTGAGVPMQFADGTLTLDLGAASNVPWTGGIFSYRVWNGCVHYGGGSPAGTQFCPGDGLYAPCPCGNINDGSMSGCDWQTLGGTAGGALDAVGSNVWTNNDTFLQATNINANFGIFFAAPTQLAGTLGDGIRCVGGGLIRLIPPTNPGGSSATHVVPLQTLDPLAAGGVTRNYQYWFRAPNSGCGTGSNTTNGYSISWM